MKNKKGRRKFLKNSALSTLGLGLVGGLNASTSSSNNMDLGPICDPTTLDYYGEGPFYTENPPMIIMNKLSNGDEEGTKLIISGRVFNLDCSQYIPGTKIDVWHANDAGAYDNDGYNLRGYMTTNSQGFYLFETIIPGKYLNGSKYRPSHIHYKITPPGFTELITQLYFEGDESIPEDAAASITSGNFDATDRIIPLNLSSDGIYEGTFDITIDGNGIPVGVQDLHIDKGMVYKTNPNPFTEELEINYGVFKKAKVGLAVYDINGRVVAVLEDKIQSAEKYNVTWRPESNLVSGHYFVVLKINDLQVHYLKVVKL